MEDRPLRVRVSRPRVSPVPQGGRCGRCACLLAARVQCGTSPGRCQVAAARRASGFHRLPRHVRVCRISARIRTVRVGAARVIARSCTRTTRLSSCSPVAAPISLTTKPGIIYMPGKWAFHVRKPPTHPSAVEGNGATRKWARLGRTRGRRRKPSTGAGWCQGTA